MLPVLTIFSLDQGKIYSQQPDAFDDQETDRTASTVAARNDGRKFNVGRLLGQILPDRGWEALLSFAHLRDGRRA